MKITQREDFGTFSSNLQDFIQSFSQGYTRLEDLTREALLTRKHITKEVAPLAQEVTLNQMGRTLVDMDKRFITSDLGAEAKSKHERLLRSLKYGTMNERQNQIKDPHVDTFEWIFQPPDNPDVLEMKDKFDYDTGRINWELSENHIRIKKASDVFCEWLMDPNASLFWICGKPGSGKSTFMKFLASNTRTLELLNTSRAVQDKGFRIASHYIWSSGQRMEAQVKGCLCSLLHQLLLTGYDASQAVLQRFPEIQHKDATSDWCEKDLKEILILLLSHNPQQCYCLFIDGLDEVDPSDGQLKVVELLQELRVLPGVKICASSRPEAQLQQYLRQFPMFKIQDLTYRDIWSFASQGLQNHFPQAQPDERVSDNQSGNDRKGYQHLVKTICEMAEGVFLWVSLAVCSLRDGLIGDDSIAELQKRLELLPTNLRDLYRAMWTRMGDNREMCQKDAAIYLNFVLHRGTVYDFVRSSDAALELLLTADTKLTDRILNQESNLSISLESLNGKRSQMIKWVSVRCAGLLEAAEETSNAGGRVYVTSRIQFINRSAREFVENDDDGRKLLAQGKMTSLDRNFRFLKVQLALVCLSSRLNLDLMRALMTVSPKQFMLLNKIFAEGGCITEEQENHLLAVVESLIPDTVAQSIWGKIRKGLGRHFSKNKGSTPERVYHLLTEVTFSSKWHAAPAIGWFSRIFLGKMRHGAIGYVNKGPA
ncbi:hypothetical protein OQA88_5425 [Cercophora sp. LCS_1]